MLSALYATVIKPLVQIIEFFYELFYEITGNEGISVIGLSFIVTFFTLPLYMVAENWQKKERLIQQEMKQGINRIKKTFKGDEQYMILATYYKQNHYHPVMALRSSFSLLIQIPFFIAAYNFLSNLGTLDGVSFLFIKDLGAPDASFRIGSFNINIIPFAMTIINCVAGAVYTYDKNKGDGASRNLSEKIQIYASAAVFLVLLYNSPSGLVVYWTMNNILSLVKNVFYKIKNPAKIIYIIACALGICALILSVFFMKNTKSAFRIGLAAAGIFIPIIPAAKKYFSNLLDKYFTQFDLYPPVRFSVFIISALILAVLAGSMIPSILMESEPEQYSYIDSYKSPLFFILYTMYQALGFFVVWPLCFYALFSAKTKKAMAVIYAVAAFIALLNVFAFSGNYGSIGPNLIFMEPQHFMPEIKQVILNVLSIFALFAATVILLQRFPKTARSICMVFLTSLILTSSKNILSINRSFKNMEKPIIRDRIDPVFHLSKTDKNVIVIMMDAFFSPFVPYILHDKAELKDKLDGFIFFPNTVSLGQRTMLGTPGLFGGYDYTPFEINKRSDKTLKQKHNEALLSLPALFLQNGWQATVSDLPYENYLEQPITDMYKGYDKIRRIATRGVYSDLWYKRNNIKKSPFMSESIKRNFIWFGFFKMMPPALRQLVYHNEYWLSYNRFEDLATFVDNYSAVDFLPELFDTSGTTNSIFLLDNETTHEAVLLKSPDYLPVKQNKTTIQTDAADTGKTGEEIRHVLYQGGYEYEAQYSTMAGVLFKLAQFIDYLKNEGVYDNTRIIMVSDHGLNLKIEAPPALAEMQGFSWQTFSDSRDGQIFPFMKERVTASLFFKDFNERGEIKYDFSLMTNADTPSLAVKDMIDEAENPFTGNKLAILDAADKADLIKIAVAPPESTRNRNNFKFIVDEWYTVKENIFENSNWSKYEAAR